MRASIHLSFLLPFICISHAADTPRPALNSQHWTVTHSQLFQAGPTGSFDEIAVKDPTIVQHEGQWHVFYTAKPKSSKERVPAELGYATASSLEGLHKAEHIQMLPTLGGVMIAPQVFYFAPQKLWYLIGHTLVDKKLQPVFSTNPDIANVQGWIPMQRLQTNRQATRTWIDFWVICDEAKAHLFYSDHTDTLWRMECPLAEFPQGLSSAQEQLALQASGVSEQGAWNFHEAAHIYRVQSDGRYLALLEGGYSHPIRKNVMEARDSRNRFMLAYTAQRLEGPWTRVEPSENEFLAERDHLFNPDGTPCLRYTQVSHPELIRSGIDQRLEVPDYRLKLLFQGFDGSQLKDDYNYNDLPWELAIMENR